MHTRLMVRAEGWVPTLLRRGPRALLGLGLCLGFMPVALLAGRTLTARCWLRGCVQVGHLFALAGGRYEEYGGA